MIARTPKLASLSTNELIHLFAESAMSRTAAMEALKPKVGNRHFDMMTNIYVELKSRGPTAQRSMLPLLNHADPEVRCNAAALIMEFAPSQAEPILRSLAQLDGFVGYEAEVVLEVWEQGELEFPPYKAESR
jgi:hypothetical protein